MIARSIQAPDSIATISTELTDVFYREVLDAMGDLVLIKGPQSRLLWANKAFCELYGMTNEQLRGIIDAPFNEPDFTLQYVKDDAHVFDTGKILDIPEEPVTRHDGVVRILHTVKYPLRNAAGNVIATFGVSQDITDRKQLQHQIERQSEAIRALSTPIIEIWDGVLIVPMLGVLDSSRAAIVMERLLSEVSQKGARFALLDLTGVEAIDTGTANHLIKLVKALRLLGAEGVITGIQPMVAHTMITLGLDLARIVTCSNLRQGLGFCMAGGSD